LLCLVELIASLRKFANPILRHVSASRRRQHRGKFFARRDAPKGYIDLLHQIHD
jgi:hypothetical protein